MQKKAIILFSGGLDSTTCLAIAKAQGYLCYALSFTYGQKHSIELERAKAIAKQMDVVEHRILQLPVGDYGGSALTDKNIPVEDYKGTDEVPTTYVPARNTIFLSFALSWGEVIGVYEVFFGANQIDYSGYVDCKPDYIRAFEKLAQLATQAGVDGQPFTIHAPLLYLDKAAIIREGQRLGVDYSQTLSCYRPNAQGHSCGFCDSCTYRKKGFMEAGVSDPTSYIKSCSKPI